MVGCNREEFQCSRQHRVVVEYNKDPVQDHWELIYGRCVPGDVRPISMQCGPYAFHEGTVYTAADIGSWKRLTIRLPERVFSRSVSFIIVLWHGMAPLVLVSVYCLSNALHSSIGQNIKSHTCPLSVVRYPLSGVRSPARVWKTSNGHKSATRHPIYFVFGSRLGFF